jgi:5-methylcytosine-specific restriction endonuclease McrA
MAHRLLWYVTDDGRNPELRLTLAHLFADLLKLREENPAISVDVYLVDGLKVIHRDRIAAAFYPRKNHVTTYLMPALRRQATRFLGDPSFPRWGRWPVRERTHMAKIVKLLAGLPKPTRIERERMSRSIPRTVREEVFARDNGRCCRCGSERDLHFDHILPFSRGGASKSTKNIQLLCEACNLEKGASLKF